MEVPNQLVVDARDLLKDIVNSADCATCCTYDVVVDVVNGRPYIHPLQYNASGEHQAEHYQDLRKLGGEL